MSGVWPELILIVVLVVVNALLSGTEIALISLREPQLRRMESQGGAGQVVVGLARDPNRFLATIQIGITLAGFMASAVAATSIAGPLTSSFGWTGDTAETVTIVIVTIALSFLTLVFGELAPKRLALQRSESWAMAMGRPLHGLSVLMTPFVWLLSVSTDAVVRLFGGSAGTRRQAVDLRELRDLILASGALSDDHSEIFLGAFDLADRTVEQVMTPRTDVRLIEDDLTVGDAIDVVIESRHSRLPVTPSGEGLDAAVGIVDLSDLVVADRSIAVLEIVKPVLAFPESIGVLPALRRMQASRTQMGFVVDEFGGVEGIVTVEDIVEEVVGEIYDEDDPDVAAVVRAADGTFLIPGRCPIHDLVDVGIDVPEGEYTTVAGLVLDAMGRLPEPDESVEIGSWAFTILEVDSTAITWLRASALPVA